MKKPMAGTAEDPAMVPAAAVARALAVKQPTVELKIAARNDRERCRKKLVRTCYSFSNARLEEVLDFTSGDASPRSVAKATLHRHYKPT